jgi:hypothetical protein
MSIESFPIYWIFWRLVMTSVFLYHIFLPLLHVYRECRTEFEPFNHMMLTVLACFTSRWSLPFGTAADNYQRCRLLVYGLVIGLARRGSPWIFVSFSSIISCILSHNDLIFYYMAGQILKEKKRSSIRHKSFVKKKKK